MGRRPIIVVDSHPIWPTRTWSRHTAKDLGPAAPQRRLGSRETLAKQTLGLKSPWTPHHGHPRHPGSTALESRPAGSRLTWTTTWVDVGAALPIRRTNISTHRPIHQPDPGAVQNIRLKKTKGPCSSRGLSYEKLRSRGQVDADPEPSKALISRHSSPSAASRACRVGGLYRCIRDFQFLR